MVAHGRARLSWPRVLAVLVLYGASDALHTRRSTARTLGENPLRAGHGPAFGGAAPA